ncbi:hypothetical protein [Thioclava electrotropha]|uniref:hypothetical protein n=1 Tax=Thioclava electrotropha TaxID=1549850 RepID=UPI0023A8BF44|nr:hypothetical protein [Thioclava electrotropha]|tara:strand:+ start:171 stop:368 length:198 start_codon:yes stop_codon:yes gene_type:complete
MIGPSPADSIALAICWGICFQNERSVEISVKKTLANFYFWRKKNDPHFSRDRGFDRAAASMRLIE